MDGFHTSRVWNERQTRYSINKLYSIVQTSRKTCMSSKLISQD